MSDLLTLTLERLEAEVERVGFLARAVESLASASLDSEAAALHVLADSLHERATEKACATAAQYGYQVALHEIVPTVRAETGDDPIVWLTGNSMMPSLRAWGNSERVYQLSYDLGDVWSSYVERLESTLDQAEVFMAEPEYDNALYAVDLRRWQGADEHDTPDDVDITLQSEWKLRDA
jgi:hypothetical protein